MKKFLIGLSTLVVLFFSGCASTSSSFNAPDGSTYKKVKCSQNSTECMQKASANCPNGRYKVISSESHAGGLVADVFPGPVTWYSITYKCGPSDGKMPTFPFTGSKYTPPVTVNVRHSGSVYHY